MAQLRGHLSVAIGRAFIGANAPYIYVLCSKANNVLYIGQTNARGGVFTRLGGHLDRGGTFRARLLEHLDLPVEELTDLQVWAFALPAAPRFYSEDETYREGVEYRVQKRLQSVRAQWQPYFRIVSNITAPETTDFPEVKSLAAQIVTELEQLYHWPQPNFP